MNVNKDRKKYVYSEALDPIISDPSIPEAAPVTPVSAVFPPEASDASRSAKAAR